MARPKKVKEPEAPTTIIPAHAKLVGVAQSKRAPLVTGEKGKMLYGILKEAGAKIALEQEIVMSQYADGKKPLGKYVVFKEFRVVMDLTE